MNDLTIAIAQTRPVKGDIEANVKDHTRFIESAAGKKADIIIFPELSLTGYEPTLAAELAVSADDKRFDGLRELSRKYGITIIAGVPVENGGEKPFIGSVCFRPDGLYVYLKRHLHPGEEKFFSEGNEVGLLNVKGTTIGLAICADIADETHPQLASGGGASVYAASAFITPQGYEKDSALLRGYASQYRMAVALANFCGESGGIESAGRSAFWDESGRLIVEADESAAGMIIVDKKLMKWGGALIKLRQASTGSA